MIKNKLFICQNCGKRNHHIKNCYEPKTSFGIILYKMCSNELKLLLIRRRNTLGFVQFVRGQYGDEDFIYLKKLFNVMTEDEISVIRQGDFKLFWKTLWLLDENELVENMLSTDYEYSLNKFNKLKKGFMFKNKKVALTTLLKQRISKYTQQEWGFPKGRKNRNETNLETACREFNEETRIPLDNIKVSDKQFTEFYKSYDNIDYKNIYFLAEYVGPTGLDLTISNTSREQYTEVSAICFFDIFEAIHNIRDYSKEKKKIVLSVSKYINKKLNKK